MQEGVRASAPILSGVPTKPEKSNTLARKQAIISEALSSALESRLQFDRKLPWEENKLFGRLYSTKGEIINGEIKNLLSMMTEEVTTDAAIGIGAQSALANARLGAIQTALVERELKMAMVKDEYQFQRNLAAWVLGYDEPNNYQKCNWFTQSEKKVLAKATKDLIKIDKSISDKKNKEIERRRYIANLRDILTKRLFMACIQLGDGELVRGDSEYEFKFNTFLGRLSGIQPQSEEECYLYYKYIILEHGGQNQEIEDINAYDKFYHDEKLYMGGHDIFNAKFLNGITVLTELLELARTPKDDSDGGKGKETMDRLTNGKFNASRTVAVARASLDGREERIAKEQEERKARILAGIEKHAKETEEERNLRRAKAAEELKKSAALKKLREDIAAKDKIEETKKKPGVPVKEPRTEPPKTKEKGKLIDVVLPGEPKPPGGVVDYKNAYLKDVFEQTKATSYADMRTSSREYKYATQSHPSFPYRLVTREEALDIKKNTVPDNSGYVEEHVKFRKAYESANPAISYAEFFPGNPDIAKELQDRQDFIYNNKDDVDISTKELNQRFSDKLKLNMEDRLDITPHEGITTSDTDTGKAIMILDQFELDITGRKYDVDTGLARRYYRSYREDVYMDRLLTKEVEALKLSGAPLLATVVENRRLRYKEMRREDFSQYQYGSYTNFVFKNVKRFEPAESAPPETRRAYRLAYQAANEKTVGYAAEVDYIDFANGRINERNEIAADPVKAKERIREYDEQKQAHEEVLANTSNRFVVKTIESGDEYTPDELKAMEKYREGLRKVGSTREGLDTLEEELEQMVKQYGRGDKNQKEKYRNAPEFNPLYYDYSEVNMEMELIRQVIAEIKEEPITDFAQFSGVDQSAEKREKIANARRRLHEKILEKQEKKAKKRAFRVKEALAETIPSVRDVTLGQFYEDLDKHPNSIAIATHLNLKTLDKEHTWKEAVEILRKDNETISDAFLRSQKDKAATHQVLSDTSSMNSGTREDARTRLSIMIKHIEADIRKIDERGMNRELSDDTRRELAEKRVAVMIMTRYLERSKK